MACAQVEDAVIIPRERSVTCAALVDVISCETFEKEKASEDVAGFHRQQTYLFGRLLVIHIFVGAVPML